RARPRRHAAGHARLLHRRLAARAARQLNRLDTGTAREEPAARGRQPALPDPALDPHPHLGSHILAIERRQLPLDWTARYNTTPVLMETFVETPRYTGAVYRASGWTLVGATQGRGRYNTRTATTSRRRTSGCDPCARTGSAS
ncbi:MAG: DUF4338 domain-containing protein, partial [Gammaproteobacteria bacterium]|nr:DUF4338 domain-containing protein [Gammaproteobacteria bacterium]